jgi:hypothetical protein
VRRIIENGQQYVIREGRRIAIEADYGDTPPKQRKARKPFKAEWVRFPATWREALHKANSTGAAYDLAITVLFESFKRERGGGDIVLSATVTRMPRSTRRRAVKELAKLGLIRLHNRIGGQASRVSIGVSPKEKGEK